MTLEDLRPNRNLLFWRLHTLGWSAYLITQYMGALLYEKPASYVKVVLVAGASGFLLSAPLRHVYRWLWSQRPLVIFPSVLLAAWVTALIWRAIINSAYGYFVGDWMGGEPWFAIFSGALSSTYLLLCLVRPLFRHQVLRDPAARARGGAEGFGAGAGSTGQDDLNTPRSFPEIETRAQWKVRAQEIREQVLVSSGLWPLPERTPLRAKIFGKVERDGYSVEKVYFQTYPGFYLAGNLYLPLGKGKGPFPGVLNPHGHWANGRMADSAKDGSVPARCISFARQGLVAFLYDMVGYTDTHFPDSLTPDSKAKRPFYYVHGEFGPNHTDELWGISLMGLQTWNSIRALDFLEPLPDVDKRRLACTGASGGGTQTFMLGVVDDRLAAQAPVCMVSHSMQGGCSCENAPGLRVES